MKARNLMDGLPHCPYALTRFKHHS